MSAAHELVERGFEVVVLERRDLPGGKARSIPVAETGADPSGHQLAAPAFRPSSIPARRARVPVLPAASIST